MTALQSNQNTGVILANANRFHSVTDVNGIINNNGINTNSRIRAITTTNNDGKQESLDFISENRKIMQKFVSTTATIQRTTY